MEVESGQGAKNLLTLPWGTQSMLSVRPGKLWQKQPRRPHHRNLCCTRPYNGVFTFVEQRATLLGRSLPLDNPRNVEILTLPGVNKKGRGRKDLVTGEIFHLNGKVLFFYVYPSKVVPVS